MRIAVAALAIALLALGARASTTFTVGEQSDPVVIILASVGSTIVVLLILLLMWRVFRARRRGKNRNTAIFADVEGDKKKKKGKKRRSSSGVADARRTISIRSNMNDSNKSLFEQDYGHFPNSYAQANYRHMPSSRSQRNSEDVELSSTFGIQVYEKARLGVPETASSPWEPSYRGSADFDRESRKHHSHTPKNTRDSAFFRKAALETAHAKRNSRLSQELRHNKRYRQPDNSMQSLMANSGPGVEYEPLSASHVFPNNSAASSESAQSTTTRTKVAADVNNDVVDEENKKGKEKDKKKKGKGKPKKRKTSMIEI